jgi:hypothetical protein
VHIGMEMILTSKEFSFRKGEKKEFQIWENQNLIMDNIKEN